MHLPVYYSPHQICIGTVSFSSAFIFFILNQINMETGKVHANNNQKGYSFVQDKESVCHKHPYI